MFIKKSDATEILFNEFLRHPHPHALEQAWRKNLRGHPGPDFVELGERRPDLYLPFTCARSLGERALEKIAAQGVWVLEHDMLSLMCPVLRHES